MKNRTFMLFKVIDVFHQRAVLWGCFILTSLLLASCASQQNKVNQAKEFFKRGQLAQTVAMIDEAIPSKNNVYHLERATVMRLMGYPRLADSSKSFLIADEFLKKNELKRVSVAGSLSSLGGYVLAEGIGKDYDLKGFEGSLLAYHLALNYVLQGQWENARIEVMKMIQREKSLAQYNEKKYQAIEAERQKGVKEAPDFRLNTSFAQGNPVIGGYPVNTLTSPEVLNLKNSYQSAAAHYLAAFIFEQQKDDSLSAPGYRQAIELRPDLPFLKDGLKNLDANVAKGPRSGVTDTLFIFESGFLPFIGEYRVNLPIPVGGNSTPKIVSIVYPYIQSSTERFNISQARLDTGTLTPEMVTNVDAMARRDLKDEMPGYMLRGTSRAIASVMAQVIAERATLSSSRNKNQGALIGALASLATGISMSSFNSADVRHWSSLPSNIYMARALVPHGVRDFSVPTPDGVVAGRKIIFANDMQIVYVRIFRDRATIMASTDAPASVEAISQPLSGIAR
jgi:hypothetical protein